MIRTPSIAVSLGLGFAAGCRSPDLPAPVIDEVTPAFAFNGESEVVEIRGHNFYPVIAVDAWQGGADVDKSWSAWLYGPLGEREVPLERRIGVSLQDEETLGANVQSGLPAGIYDVGVESPTGLVGLLPRGFTVTDTRAYRLDLNPLGVVHTIGESAMIEIRLLDLGEHIVDVPFDVSVSATVDGVGVPIDRGSLVETAATPDGHGVTGTLVDGTAVVSLSLQEPGVVTVGISPAESSPVVGDTTTLEFLAGQAAEVRIDLPGEEDPLPEFDAGQPLVVTAELVDELGNAVASSESVKFIIECSLSSGWFEATLEGPTAVQVIPQTASTTSCPLAKVSVWQGPPGESGQFVIRPGPASQFEVGLAGGAVRAGDDGDFTIIPRDAWSNDTVWDGTLSFELSTGAPFVPSCGPGPFADWQVCTGQLTVAAVDQELEVTGTTGTTSDEIQGKARFTVLPDDVPASVGVEVFGPVAAGSVFEVEATSFDAWGNAMGEAEIGEQSFSLSDDLGEIDCVELAWRPSGALAFECVLFTARLSAAVTAALGETGLEGTSAPFNVVNGPLAAVRIVTDPTAVAGALTDIVVEGSDAFGNPYHVQDDPVVALTDDSGTLSVHQVTLGALGEGQTSGFFTRAGTTTVHAEQDGVLLGTSPPLQVLPATTTGLVLRPAAPWAWVGEPMDVQVEATDTFGNRTAWAGTATLSSGTTASLPIDVLLVNGVGTSAFTWVSPSFDEVLSGTAGAYQGEIAIPVSTRCLGPSADVTFGGGYPDAIACTDPATGLAAITADLSGSLSGAQPLVSYAVAEIGGALVSSAQPVLDLVMAGTGRHELVAMVQDAAGCGAEVSAEGWTGPDDDRPTGPILLSTPDVLPSVFDTVSIEVDGVVDCSRDPAVGQSIRIRTTGGAFDPAAVQATGAGLELALDANGAATVSLSMSGGMSAGDVEIHATVPGGAAAGRLVMPVIDDNIRPVVISQEPAGLWPAAVSQITFQFSEPMRERDVIEANFSVSGPQATTAVPELLPGDEVVVLTLSPPVDGSLGAYTVTVADDVRDAAGNKLSGNWTTQAADYVGSFGVVGSEPADVICTGSEPSELVLRPDGDPGLGPESDQIALGVASAAAPAWWVIEVHDVQGALVWQDWAVPQGAADTVVWTARDRRGMVVDNGVYRLGVSPDDGLGNRGFGCEVAVTVDNPLGGPP